MKTLKKIALLIVAIAIYLNIGWAVGTYYYHNVAYVEPQTTFAKFLAGGWQLFSNPQVPESHKLTLLFSQTAWSIIWPISIAVILLSWLVYLLVTAVIFLFKLIFAGGIAKAIGLG